MKKKKLDQHNVGIPEKKRGQQTGFAGNPDQNRKEMKTTPAITGRRESANKMVADSSQQHISSDATTPSTNSPSTSAMNVSPTRAGGGAGGFKRRLAKKRRAH